MRFQRSAVDVLSPLRGTSILPGHVKGSSRLGPYEPDTSHASRLKSARVAIQAFEKIADNWHLSRAQRATLLGTSKRTAYRWTKEPARGDPSRDTLERISHLIAIYEELHILFGAGAAGWVDRPNDDFAGDRPMRRMLGGNVEDIVTVRRYLELARHGWCRNSLEDS